jgi:hypothetical protein
MCPDGSHPKQPGAAIISLLKITLDSSTYAAICHGSTAAEAECDERAIVYLHVVKRSAKKKIPAGLSRRSL